MLYNSNAKIEIYNIVLQNVKFFQPLLSMPEKSSPDGMVQWFPPIVIGAIGKYNYLE